MKKWILSAVLGLSVVTLAVGVYFVQRPKETKKSEAAASTQVSIIPSQLSKNVGDTFSVDVEIDTGQNTVSGADIRVVYDSTKLEGVSITKGSFLPVELIAGSFVSERARFVYGSDPTAPKKGIGTLATITFKVLANNTTTQLTFGGASAVAAIGESGNVLTTKNPSTITLGTLSTTPPTSTPTPTSTTQPTQPPGTTPTSTPAPTPTSSGALTGDVNKDGSVNIIDIGVIIDVYGSSPPGNPAADLNADNTVNIIDIGIVIDNYQI